MHLGLLGLCIGALLTALVVIWRMRADRMQLRGDLIALGGNLQEMNASSINRSPLPDTSHPEAMQLARHIAGLLSRLDATHDNQVAALKRNLSDLRDQCTHCAPLDAANKRADELPRLKREFLGTISHELLTPMNGILGMIDLVMHERMGTEQAELCGHAQDAAMKLLGMIRDILDLTNIEAGMMQINLETTDLDALLKNVVAKHENAAVDKGIVLKHLSTLENGVSPRIDANHLHRVLDILLENAIKFTDQGEVTVTALHAPGVHDIDILVSDTGIGMNQEVLNGLFNSLQQADSSIQRAYGGLGLGLYLAAKLIKLMGGSIVANSRLGLGSTFHIKLPAEFVSLAEVDDSEHKYPQGLFV